MKKSLILLLAFAFAICGCQSSHSSSQKEAVKINLPEDDSVNGYRIVESEENGMPDKISGIDVSPNSTVNSSAGKTTSSDKTTSTNNSNDKNISYCGNKNSKKFHKSSCGSLKNTKDENKVYLGSKDDFLADGYTACKLCKP